MTTFRCPQGHESAADDWCDVCGAPIGAAAGDGAGDPGPDVSSRLSAGTGTGPAVVQGAATGPPPGNPGAAGSVGPPPDAGATCPHCGAPVGADSLFCEACGADLTTGAPPPPPAPPGPTAPDEVVGLAGARTGGAADAGSGPGWVAELWVDPDWYAAQDSDEPCPSAGAPAVVPLRTRRALVGRPSASRNIHPDVDCGADTGVSRRHAELTSDGQRWWVEDLQSANGTFIGVAGAPLPDRPITPGQRREVAEQERIYLGAWTRLVLRQATDEERAL